LCEKFCEGEAGVTLSLQTFFQQGRHEKLHVLKNEFVSQVGHPLRLMPSSATKYELKIVHPTMQKYCFILVFKMEPPSDTTWGRAGVTWCRNECTKSIVRSFFNRCYVSEFSEMYLGNRPSNWRRQATTKMRGELGLLGCLFSAGVCGLRHIDCQVPGSSGIQSEGDSLFAKQQRPSRKIITLIPQNGNHGFRKK